MGVVELLLADLGHHLVDDRPRDGIDFFPLSVDFEEKMYAVGRIPGSFMRREGRPGEKGILTTFLSSVSMAARASSM